jgi:hypothetical protein
MRQRLAELFPVILSFILPLAGLMLAIQHETQNERQPAIQLGLAALAGTVFWVAILTL